MCMARARHLERTMEMGKSTCFIRLESNVFHSKETLKRLVCLGISLTVLEHFDLTGLGEGTVAVFCWQVDLACWSWLARIYSKHVYAGLVLHGN